MTTHSRITLRMIAERANVSLTTVSAALRGRYDVASETRQKIITIARQLGYSPDPALTALVAYRNSLRNAHFKGSIVLLTFGNTAECWKDDIFTQIIFDTARMRASELGYELTPFWTGSYADNPAAWELVRMARSRWTSMEAQVLEETAGLYRMALELEPDLALARAELAFALYWMGGTEGLAKAWTEVRRALQIDSTLAMGHFVEGTLLLREGRLDEARRAFHRALAFDPNHYFAMNNLSIVEWEAGRFEESLLWARRALDRAPDEANNYYHVSVPLLDLEVDEVTEPFLREGLKRETWVAGFGAMGPKPYPRIPLNLTTLHLLRGEVEEARAWLEQGLAVYPDDLELRSRETLILMATGSPEADSVLEARYAEGRGSPLSYAVVLRRRGEEARVDSLLAPLLTFTLDRAEAGFERPSLPVTIAQLYALKGEEEEALAWLERAYEAGYRRARWLQVLPQLESLRDHPRFRALVERMSRDVARMRARVDLAGLPGGG